MSLIRKVLLSWPSLLNQEVSSKEVVETHLKRIEEVNPEINAITVTLEEQLLIQKAITKMMKGRAFSWRTNYY